MERPVGALDAVVVLLLGFVFELALSLNSEDVVLYLNRQVLLVNFRQIRLESDLLIGLFDVYCRGPSANAAGLGVGLGARRTEEVVK
jgi:hypothetical protein